MLAAALIVFRELFEAGLIIGIVLAVTRGIPGNRLWVALGAAGGLAGSGVLAACLGALSNAFDGTGQELFNAAIMGTAVVMLAWHNIWMARHGREMAAHMRSAGQAVASGAKSMLALSVVVAVAVLREGSEVVLFLYGVAATSGSGSAASLIAGAIIGLALGGSVSALAYLGLVRVPTRYLFLVTSALITFLAAGMAAQCVAFLEQAGAVSWLGQEAWDSSALLSQASVIGRALHTLVGYTDQPSYLQLVVYLTVVLAIWCLTRLFSLTAARPFGAPASAR